MDKLSVVSYAGTEALPKTSAGNDSVDRVPTASEPLPFHAFLDKFRADNGTAFGAPVLHGLNRMGNIYAGTVPHATKQKNRAKNKVGRKQHRANRSR